MSEPFCNDGCDLSQRELLNMARIGLQEGPTATAEEFASILETLPAQIAGQPTKRKNRSLKALQKAGLPRLDYRELFKIEGEPLSEEDVKAMSEYFAEFLEPAPDTGCVRCGKRQSGGSNIIDQFLNTHFTWGLANGEGFCSHCKYPARAYHRNVGPIKFLNMILQYHPDALSKRK